MTPNIRVSILFYWLTKFSVILLLFGCNSDGSDSNNSRNNAPVPSEMQPLYDEIMAAHDEVMPRMSELTKLQGQMVTILDTLRVQDPIDMEALSEANRVLGKLNQAENAMWDWMHNFGKLDSVPDSEKQFFLQNEKTSAFSMRDLMLESLEKASSYISENAVQDAL